VSLQESKIRRYPALIRVQMLFLGSCAYADHYGMLMNEGIADPGGQCRENGVSGLFQVNAAGKMSGEEAQGPDTGNAEGW